MRLRSALEILPRLYGANSYLRTAGYLFVVGHMRSYSSLLAHILGSHPRIVGYAEMHQKYRNVLDLLELTRKVERTCDKSGVVTHDTTRAPFAISARYEAVLKPGVVFSATGQDVLAIWPSKTAKAPSWLLGGALK